MEEIKKRDELLKAIFQTEQEQKVLMLSGSCKSKIPQAMRQESKKLKQLLISNLSLSLNLDD